MKELIEKLEKATEILFQIDERGFAVSVKEAITALQASEWVEKEQEHTEHFKNWLTKYFETPELKQMYKSRTSKEIFSYEQLCKKYEKAFLTPPNK